ncbi:pyridoxamine 5'-phosphate oxidase family protein [Streptomyces siamensis]|uniref:pyridoxamine 5'-phosphate oxidase family protein n=1 Tax=Streptomyces siamensis TaxID=1274986 RepID=UPI0031E99E45
MSSPPPTGNAYTATDRTVPTRIRRHASYDRELVHAILDADYLCHLGFVRDGAPVVLPTLYARVAERLYMHGSVGSRPLRCAGEDTGIAVCLTVTHVDGLVLARSAIHHAINYRSVIVHGTARQVTDPAERSTALNALIENIVPGRATDTRPANTKELAATAVVALDLDEVCAKVRTGDPNDDPEDLTLPHWTGVLPVARTYGTPTPAADLDPTITIPHYLTNR